MQKEISFSNIYKEQVEKITKSLFIIAKQLDNEKGEVVPYEFSYSFKEVETLLEEEQPPSQRFVHLVFKLLGYQLMKPIASCIIPSFRGKNLILWMTEEFPPDTPLWNDSRKT